LQNQDAMKDYIIFTHYSENELARKVVEFMNKGWIPLGNVSMVMSNHGLLYAQALIKN
jgi:hypothetical protein